MLSAKPKLLNAANIIASTRLLVIPVVVVTTLLHRQTVTGCIVFIALCTDMLDGYVARKFNQASEFGAKLDSIGDACLFLTGFFSIVCFFTGFIQAHLWQVTLLMGLYFFQLVYSLIRHKQLTSYHTYAAKLSAMAEGLFITVCLFYQPVEWLFYLTWIIGLVEQADEITLLFILPDLRQNVKGTWWVLRERKGKN